MTIFCRCTGLDDFLSLSVNQQTLQDLEELGRPAWEDCRRLRGARPLILNPTFELSIRWVAPTQTRSRGGA